MLDFDKLVKQRINQQELYYEIVVSKGLGYLTRRAVELLVLLGAKAIMRNKHKYIVEDDMYDCLQRGYEDLVSKWHNANHIKSENMFSYFTDIFKRATAIGFNELVRKSKSKNITVKTYSMNSANDGNGLHSLI